MAGVVWEGIEGIRNMMEENWGKVSKNIIQLDVYSY